MLTILSITAIISVLALSVIMTVRNHRTSGCADAKARMMSRILCTAAIMLSCGMLCGGDRPFRLLSDVMLAVVSVSVMLLSVRTSVKKLSRRNPVPVIFIMISIYYILCAVGALNLFPERVFFMLTDLTAAFSAVLFVRIVWRRLHDVKTVMKSGNVWSFVNLCVDSVYMLFPFVALLILHSVYVMFPETSFFPVLVVIMLLFLELVAMGLRVCCDSAFVVLHDHERLIVESMKISHMEPFSGPDSGGGEPYKELYERIVLYFEMSKPYLDGSLTINDVVKVVYSNKVYISKAICHYTGRNFRQFVNYYRIMYSMETFRSRPELKVSELAEMSGFNTMVSYTMAFRLFMNETPSEWCRKERAKILKTKK